MSWILWLLLLVALGIGWYVWQTFLQRTTRAPSSLPSGDDLKSLGLSEVRPATARPEAERETVSAPPSAPPDRTKPSPPPASSSAAPTPTAPHLSTVSEARPKPADAFVRADSPLWPSGPEAVQPLLRSLASTLGGGVALLRADGDRYEVDALVGVPGVRSPRALDADHALHKVPQDTVLSILGPSSRRSLTYYADPDAAVGQAVARALAEPPARRALLVADVPPGEGDLDDEALALVARYGDLIAQLCDLQAGPEPARAEETTPSPLLNAELDAELDAEPDAEPDAETEIDDAPEPEEASDKEAPDAEKVEEVLPRAVVMQREMDAARASGRALAFALVTPTDADDLLRGAPEVVARAEADLRDRLSGAGVHALEPFGDLLVGAFLDGDSAAAWAEAAADGDPPLLIGLVPDAADDPDAVRSAATSALEEAYRQGQGVVVATGTDAVD